MKYFLHSTDSGDDPFICALREDIEDGYYIFFRLLEVLAREYKGNEWQTFRTSYLYGDKLKKDTVIMEKFFRFVKSYSLTNHNPARILLKKIDDNKISLNCPKLKELSQEYWRKKFPSQDGSDAEKKRPYSKVLYGKISPKGDIPPTPLPKLAPADSIGHIVETYLTVIYPGFSATKARSDFEAAINRPDKPISRSELLAYVSKDSNRSQEPWTVIKNIDADRKKPHPAPLPIKCEHEYKEIQPGLHECVKCEQRKRIPQPVSKTN